MSFFKDPEYNLSNKYQVRVANDLLAGPKDDLYWRLVIMRRDIWLRRIVYMAVLVVGVPWVVRYILHLKIMQALIVAFIAGDIFFSVRGDIAVIKYLREDIYEALSKYDREHIDALKFREQEKQRDAKNAAFREAIAKQKSKEQQRMQAIWAIEDSTQQKRKAARKKVKLASGFVTLRDNEKPVEKQLEEFVDSYRQDENFCITHIDILHERRNYVEGLKLMVAYDYTA